MQIPINIFLCSASKLERNVQLMQLAELQMLGINSQVDVAIVSLRFIQHSAL